MLTRFGTILTVKPEVSCLTKSSGVKIGIYLEYGAQTLLDYTQLSRRGRLASE